MHTVDVTPRLERKKIFEFLLRSKLILEIHKYFFSNTDRLVHRTKIINHSCSCWFDRYRTLYTSARARTVQTWYICRRLLSHSQCSFIQFVQCQCAHSCGTSARAVWTAFNLSSRLWSSYVTCIDNDGPLFFQQHPSGQCIPTQ